MADSPPTLHDIPDPTPHLPGVTPPLWLIIAAGVLVLALVVVLIVALLLRRKPEAPPPLEDIYENSRSELRTLRDEAGGRPVAEVATRASLALRGYLAACLEEPALYETHEEFLLRDSALDKLPAGSRQRLNPLLERLAEAKYGPSARDAATSGPLVDECLEVLQGLESTRPRSVAAS